MAGSSGGAGVAAHGMDGERGSGGRAAFGDEIEQLGGPGGFVFLEEHRFRGIEDEIDDGPDFLAEELHRVAAGAGVGLPVDVARIIAGRVGAVVLEIERRAGAAAGELAGLALPERERSGRRSRPAAASAVGGPAAVRRSPSCGGGMAGCRRFRLGGS